MSISLKKVAADLVAFGVSVGAVLTVVLNLAPAIHLPAQDIGYIVAATAVVGAIVQQLRPYAAAAAKSVFTK